MTALRIFIQMPHPLYCIASQAGSLNLSNTNLKYFFYISTGLYFYWSYLTAILFRLIHGRWKWTNTPWGTFSSKYPKFSFYQLRFRVPWHIEYFQFALLCSVNVQDGHIHSWVSQQDYLQFLFFFLALHIYIFHPYKFSDHLSFVTSAIYMVEVCKQFSCQIIHLTPQ